ncbi:hypothetical protein LOAG_14147 [Loa loa]|uniref:Uncharacterized protein n=1 Tax=Loa loa TaxID=7209 RepID=A0A1S0TI76_LOALO|nr:hypothetical protein LOAG_14147 [Loa loa]EFO14373.1 hypothetical protein LOAG_14147 [Loa loa]
MWYSSCLVLFGNRNQTGYGDIILDVAYAFERKKGSVPLCADGNDKKHEDVTSPNFSQSSGEGKRGVLLVLFLVFPLDFKALNKSSLKLAQILYAPYNNRLDNVELRASLRSPVMVHWRKQ